MIVWAAVATFVDGDDESTASGMGSIGEWPGLELRTAGELPPRSEMPLCSSRCSGRLGRLGRGGRAGREVGLLAAEASPLFWMRTGGCVVDLRAVLGDAFGEPPPVE